ncbi:Dabb family protein [Fodinibius salsisoli]|uniref:Dabb family protein n=1 Tax=Fodinibius salsisoli TaxID=2820877 RepID=A0ABT3PHY8_9BACT|nr:Dabb family protein [Fodinibius salsisoli]MCW9705537.1 Dabb family protein [Fodinibius salsisoli]
MLQHTVYFYLNEDVTSKEKQQFEEGLKELLQIAEIHHAELGTPADTKERDVTDHSFAYAIYTWFETIEDCETYAEHPEHLDFIDQYNSLWADVKVYDTELIDT